MSEETLSGAAALKAALVTGIPMGRLPAYHAARDPKAPAITLGGETLSRQDLDIRSNRRARQLAAEGVIPGDLVTLALPNCLEFYETSFALWKLGATPNVVSHKLPDAELQAIVALADPRVVIGVDPARLPGRRARPAVALVDESLSAEPMPDAPPANWKAMTSGGSTGRPKIIVDHMPSLWDPGQTVLSQVVEDTVPEPRSALPQRPFHLHALQPVHRRPCGRHGEVRRAEGAGPDRPVRRHLGEHGSHHDAPHLGAAAAGARRVLAQDPARALPYGLHVPGLAQAGVYATGWGRTGIIELYGGAEAGRARPS